MKMNMRGREGSLDRVEAYPASLYEGINLNWLVLVAVAKVEEVGLDLSFESIVIAAFRLFPKKFSFQSYPEYPDAKRVHDALFRCTFKNRQWLLGRAGQGFTFTERGRQELEVARRALQIEAQPARRKTFSQTRRLERLLGEVRSAPAYVKYSKGEGDRISEGECCHVLQGTLDSDRRVLADNLTKLKSMAAELHQEDLVEFMEWVSQRFGRFLGMGGS